MNTTTELMNALVEPLGITPRMFEVYFGSEGSPYNHTNVGLPIPPTGRDADREIMEGLLRTFDDMGVIVYYIIELYNGYSWDEVRDMSNRDRLKNSRMLYIDKDFKAGIERG